MSEKFSKQTNNVTEWIKGHVKVDECAYIEQGPTPG